MFVSKILWWLIKLPFKILGIVAKCFTPYDWRKGG